MTTSKASHASSSQLLRGLLLATCLTLAMSAGIITSRSAGPSPPFSMARFVGQFSGYAGLAFAAAWLLQLVFGFNAVGTNAKVGPKNTDPTKVWREDFGISKLVDVAKRIDKDGKKLKQYTMAEVAEHNTLKDIWIIVDELVYDITSFVPKHPGGIGPVANLAGKDCTDVFANYHAQRVYKYMLPRYLIGEVTDVKVPLHVAEFRKIRQELLRLGLFETDYRFYTRLGCWLAGLFFTSLHLSLAYNGYSTRMCGAVVMGLFWQQLAGLGHDLGHSGVTHDFHLDHKIGSTLTGFMGLSTCWWKSDHNTHHVVCNAVEHDPNINYMPLMAITPATFSSSEPYFESYHKKFVAMDSVARLLVSYQHLFFYPLMALARFNLYIQGIIYLLSKPDTIHYRDRELFSLSFFFTWLGLLVSSLASWRQALAWILVSHAAAGLLHIQIVLSHWTMHFYKGRAYNDETDEWYVTQLRTTMNVATPELLDYAHIGLQFQIEHHLYPRLPRHNLRKARVMVKALAKKHNLPYHEPSFFAGNVEMWTSLYNTAIAARGAKKGDSGFYHSAIWEGLNING